MKEDNISDIEEISTHSRNDPKEVPAPKEENNYNPNRMRSCLQNKQSCLEFIESTPATAFMAVVTIYALYSDDIQVLGFDKSADNVFMIMSSTAFFLFVLEICIQCWCRENYLKRPSISALFCRGHNLKSKWKSFCSLFNFGSFYFWLDLLATLTMMFEIPWMTFATADGIDNNFENARAGKASRAGAKAARFLRVVRMIRLIRLVKLYKYFVSKNKFKKEGSASIFPDHEDEKALLNMPPESHVGAEMSDRTTKKVIIGILIMLIVIPLLQVEKLEYINEYGMHLVLQQRARVNKTYQDIINWEFSESLFLNNTDCISLMYSGFEDGIREFGIIPGGRANPETLRSKEKSIISIFSPENGNSSLMAVFDVKQKSNEEAFLNILLTSFVVVLLAVGTMTFSRDVNKLVILPIEKMVHMVQEISANPLGNDCSLSLNDLKGKDDDGMETTLLIRTISKIAGLMRVGFGEAGAEIIGRNLNMCSDKNGCSTISLVGNGTKILSIFAFCDVRNFTDTTECLQEEVMLFVNRIAHILHSVVAQCNGSANKNIGDAFLLTWKLSPGKIGSCEDHAYAGDRALYSMLKTMIEMIRHEDFICNFSPSALGALYARIPGYKCQIGCGLHFGWAIEGAIGSDKKIDASYISPHVNLSEYLESSTKLYGVPILLSDTFYKLLSPNVAKYCRKVDTILKSESDEITSIYTYDANLNIKIEKDNTTHVLPNDTFTLHILQRQRSKYVSTTQLQDSSYRKITKFRSSKVIRQNDYVTAKDIGDAPEIILRPFTVDVWDNDQELVRLRSHFTHEMRELWERAMNAFDEGDWNHSKENLKLMLKITDGKDGPTKQLLMKIAMTESATSTVLSSEEPNAENADINTGVDNR